MGGNIGAFMWTVLTLTSCHNVTVVMITEHMKVERKKGFKKLRIEAFTGLDFSKTWLQINPDEIPSKW